MNTDKCKCVSAVEMAAVHNISYITNDRIEALAGGHGMVNLAVHSVANVLAEELLKGEKLSIDFADTRRLPVGDIIKKAIDAAEKSGADAANAALLTACELYIMDSAAQVGIPAGNRKLGATCRMIAGVDCCGVQGVPTPKMNSKISAFPAVMAVYDAMLKGELCDIKGHDIPANVGGGPLYGHSALGEDIVWPQMAKRGAEIGVKAMIDAFDGAAIGDQPFICAVLGAAPILEIIHPDAEVPEGEGTYGRTTSVQLVGRAAVKAAGLPEKLHVQVTHEEIDTAKLVGDVALILKDIGGPSVIGMMAFDEIFSIFEENIAGFSGGPLNGPLGHVAAYSVLGMKVLMANEGDVEKTKQQLVENRLKTALNPEVAMLSINTIARKADSLVPGVITKMLIEMTEPARRKAIYDRAVYAFDAYTNGQTIEDVIRHFDQERIDYTCKSGSRLFSAMTGQDIKIEVLNLECGARRKASKLARKYMSFDMMIDMRVTIDGKVYELPNFAADLIPKIVRGERPDLAPAAPWAAAVADDLSLNACIIVNMTVTTAMAAVMGLDTPKEAAAKMEAAAFLSRSIPGGKKSGRLVAQMAVDMMNYDPEY